MTEPQSLTISSIVRQSDNDDVYLVTFNDDDSCGRYFSTADLTRLGIAIPPVPDPHTTFDPDYDYPIGTVLLYSGSGKLRVKLADDQWIGGSGEAAPTPNRNARYSFDVIYVPDPLRQLGISDSSIRYAAKVWDDPAGGSLGTSANTELVRSIGAAAAQLVSAGRLS